MDLMTVPLNSNQKAQISSDMVCSLKGLSVFVSLWSPQPETHVIYLRIYFSHDPTASFLCHGEVMEGSLLQVKYEEVQ